MPLYKPEPLDCLTDAQAGYIAGIIDGEGTIGMSYRAPSGSRERARERKPQVRAQLRVCVCDKTLIEWLVDTTGLGTVIMVKRKNPPAFWRLPWVWSLGAKQGTELLLRVSPYMLIKRRQAELFIEATVLRANNHWRQGGTAWGHPRHDAIVAEFKTINTNNHAHHSRRELV